MAHLVYYTFSDIPSEMVDILIKDLKKYDESIEKSQIRDPDNKNPVTKSIRKSGNAWINSSTWIGGFVWYYIMRANRENFMYNIEDIDSGHMQYTEYQEGEYYDWHVDDDIDRCLFNDKLLTSADNHGENLAVLNGERIRKLSFTIQLSDPEDYEGGELEFKGNDDEPFFPPNKKGTIIIFDSRTRHRVCKVKSGVRRSLVGWVVGPRWK
tara:strand:- start:248 stop:877 length:630 start_codon:yes stop_codon:yes gene_type:complete